MGLTVCLQEWFAVYVELNQQIATLLSIGEEEDLAELKALQQQLSDVCYRQATQLEGRQNVLQAAQGFHSTSQEVKHEHSLSILYPVRRQHTQFINISAGFCL